MFYLNSNRNSLEESSDKDKSHLVISGKSDTWLLSFFNGARNGREPKILGDVQIVSLMCNLSDEVSFVHKSLNVIHYTIVANPWITTNYRWYVGFLAWVVATVKECCDSHWPQDAQWWQAGVCIPVSGFKCEGNVKNGAKYPEDHFGAFVPRSHYDRGLWIVLRQSVFSDCKKQRCGGATLFITV